MTELLNIGFAIDVIMLGALAFTIFYAIRLSSQLSILKQSKSDLEQLVSNLAININRAQEAIQEMQDVAIDANESLRSSVTNANEISEELKFIVESGQSLADRLENAATQRGQTERLSQPHTQRARDSETLYEDQIEDTPPQPNDRPRVNVHVPDTPAGPPPKISQMGAVSPFSIRDREYESFEDTLNNMDEEGGTDNGTDDDLEAFSSYAERELAQALRRNK